MKLTILGSGISVIRKKRKASGYLLETNGQALLFDCGWGVPENLLSAGVNIQKIDHIFITHPHSDHMGSLMNLLQSIYVSGLYYPKTNRLKPLDLHGYPGFKHDYEILRRILFPEREEKYKIYIYEYHKARRKLDGFTVKSAIVPHVPQYFKAVSFRIDAAGKSFVYSGDMGDNNKFVALAKNANLAVLEMSVPPEIFRKDGPRPNHLSPYECGLIAARAGIKRLVLSHLYDNVSRKDIISEVRKNFTGKLIIARDLQKILI